VVVLPGRPRQGQHKQRDAMRKAHSMTPTAYCAHTNVQVARIDHGDGSMHDEWRCRDCQIAFWPSYEVKRLRKVLFSIAKNTCCDRCNEAALLAQQALGVD
jgi:hypothetical protein